MRIRSFLVGILILLFASAYAATPRDIGVAEDPGEIGMGARPMGMGRAFVAIADDENAIFVNPAGLSFVTRPCLTSMYTSLMSDVNYFLIGFNYPFALFKNGGIGVGYIQSGVPGIISTSQSGFSMTDYYSRVIIFGASFMPGPDLSLGSSLKLFSQGFSGTVNYAGTGYDVDLGLKWAPDKKLSLGVNLKNIIPSSLGGKINWPNGDEQSTAAVAKIGLKVLTDDKKLTLAFDSDIQMERPLPSTQHLGVEWGIHPNLTLRGGIDQSLNAATGGLGTNITFGVGLNISNLKLDYAYHPYFDESNNTTHYISITYLFPEPLKKSEKDKTVLAKTATAESAPIAQTATEEMRSLKSKKTAVKPVEEPKQKELKLLSTTYLIKRGDTLSDISRRFYGSTIQVTHLAKYNHISNPSEIHVGKKIKIPARNGKLKSETGSYVRAYAVPAEPIPTAQTATAETLLLKAEAIGPKSAIETNLPAETSAESKAIEPAEMEEPLEQIAPAEKPAAAAVSVKSAAKRGYTVYTIKPGDTLNKIAREFYKDTKHVQYLAKYNRISNPSEIHAGKKIKIPALKVKPGPKKIKKGVVSIESVGLLIFLISTGILLPNIRGIRKIKIKRTKY